MQVTKNLGSVKMQAVILAAGKSTRTYPLTLTRPKPLLKAANKTLLEHNLDKLNGIVDEAIVIVGYKKNMIKKFIGNKYKNIRIKYVEQKKQLGTAHALSVAEPYIKGRFVLMMGDDIYSQDDIKNCIKYIYSILTTKVKNPRNFGVVIAKSSVLVDFIEKPKKFISNLISTAFYSLDKKIFNYIEKIKKSKRSEFELPDAIKLLSKEEKVYLVRSKRWLPVVNALDLLKADNILRKNKNIIGKNSKIYGKIKNSSIGNNCTIKGDVKNSIVMDKTIVDENSLVESSVIGENVHLSGRISNSVVADNAELKNVTVKNCKIWPNKAIQNKIIEKDAT